MHEPRFGTQESNEADHQDMSESSFGSLARALAVGVASFITGSGAVGAGSPTESTPIVAREPSSRAETTLLLERRLTIDTTPLPLEQLLGAVTSLSGVKIEVLWEGSNYPNGLARDFELGLTARSVTVRGVLERIAAVLEREGRPSTWQILQDGRLQFGTKESLNRFQERRIIDLRDLTTEAPRFDGAPDFNLNGALTQRSGGGGGSIIGDPREDSTPRRTTQDGLERMKEIIIETVEPEQWVEAGGSGGSIRIYNGTLLIQAAPYILRGL